MCFYHFLLSEICDSAFLALNFPCMMILSFLYKQSTAARPVRVVDIPGHPRVRGSVDSYLEKGAGGVVFVVDSVEFMPKKTDAAE